jgi:hypothetical protein
MKNNYYASGAGLIIEIYEDQRTEPVEFFIP